MIKKKLNRKGKCSKGERVIFLESKGKKWGQFRNSSMLRSLIKSQKELRKLKCKNGTFIIKFMKTCI